MRTNWPPQQKISTVFRKKYSNIKFFIKVRTEGGRRCSVRTDRTKLIVAISRIHLKTTQNRKERNSFACLVTPREKNDPCRATNNEALVRRVVVNK